MRRMIFYIVLWVFTSCGILMGDKDLGKGYILWDIGGKTSIVFNEKGSNQGTGLEVIPYKVVCTEYDENYIIVLSKDMNTKLDNYWIIDKRISIDLNDCYDQKSCDSLLRTNVTGPLDSTNFYNQLYQRNILLRFKENL